MKKNQQTFIQRTEDVTRQWHLVDVKDQILGRISTQIAVKLIGKDKPTYTPHTDAGDYVVVINAREVKVTRDKDTKKTYSRHSGYPGGLHQRTFEEMLQKHPEEVIRLAVINMLPKNRLRSRRMARLKIYADAQHNHESQLGGK